MFMRGNSKCAHQVRPPVGAGADQRASDGEHGGSWGKVSRPSVWTSDSPSKDVHRIGSSPSRVAAVTLGQRFDLACVHTGGEEAVTLEVFIWRRGWDSNSVQVLWIL